MAYIVGAAHRARFSHWLKETALMRRTLLILLVSAINAPINAQSLPLDRYRLVDLTHELSGRTDPWPGMARFRLDTVTATKTWAVFNLFVPEHVGTHLDAPRHVSSAGMTTEQIPLERLIAPAIVIDVRSSVRSNPDYALTVADIAAFEAKHGRIPAGSIVVALTGWSAHWGDAAMYFGRDSSGVLHFPSYGAAAATFLVTQRHVSMLGVDSPSTDVGSDGASPVHFLLANAQVLGLENLFGLEQLPPVGATLIALPIKTVGGSGGPIRVVAMVPR